jgi:hypothetical protein
MNRPLRGEEWIKLHYPLRGIRAAFRSSPFKQKRRKRMVDFVELLRVAVEQTNGDVTKEFRVVDDLSEMQNDFFQEWEAYCEQWQ